MSVRFITCSSYGDSNTTPIVICLGRGTIVGGGCEFTCDKRLHHVFCSPITNKCECEKNYPVKIGRSSVSLDNETTSELLSLSPSDSHALIQKGPRKGCAKRKFRATTNVAECKFHFQCFQLKSSTNNAFMT